MEIELHTFALIHGLPKELISDFLNVDRAMKENNTCVRETAGYVEEQTYAITKSTIEEILLRVLGEVGEDLVGTLNSVAENGVDDLVEIMFVDDLVAFDYLTLKAAELEKPYKKADVQKFEEEITDLIPPSRREHYGDSSVL